MAKCSKCSRRKGKRSCPALGTAICPQCCAEGRLQTIPCPHDCRHLRSEFYQQERRRERARSQGKVFLDTNARLFSSREALDFAFNLQADIYFFLARETRLDDATVRLALESLRNSLSKVYVPEAMPHPLAKFLVNRLENSRRYPPSPTFGKEDQRRALTSLLNHVRDLGGDGTYRYFETISAFFDALDFEADLDYSPEDDTRQETGERELPRSAGGLLLPFQPRT